MNKTVLAHRVKNVGVNNFILRKGSPVPLWLVRQYTTKIIVAWGEAISGNKKIKDWLKENGYPELSCFVYALQLQDSARKWLMDNNCPELMALVMGSEGDKKALNWLRANSYSKLALIAEGADNDNTAIEELLKMDEKEWAMISLKIRAVKNSIQEDNEDWHKQSRW